LGQPQLLFSVTNKSHEVFQGMLELVGPPSARTSSANPTARPALNPRPGKTVMLTGATNELLNATNNLRVVRVHTDSTLFPGETLVGLTKLTDGQMVSNTTSFFINRHAKRVQTTSHFSWTLPDGFTVDDFEAAAKQLRKDKTGRPLELIPGKPFELFTVTNQFGGIVSGYLEFERAEPPGVSGGAGPKPEATIHGFRPFGVGLLVFYAASVPPGYFLEATDDSADLGEGQALTSISGSGESHSSWSAPRSFTFEQQREAVAQMQQLAAQGPVQVTYGEPRQVFAITNKTGEVYRGCFELVGPATSANQ
jgi:hypothetical protein